MGGNWNGKGFSLPSLNSGKCHKIVTILHEKSSGPAQIS
jgi:hypothetical protein